MSCDSLESSFIDDEETESDTSEFIESDFESSACSCRECNIPKKKLGKR